MFLLPAWYVVGTALGLMSGSENLRCDISHAKWLLLKMVISKVEMTLAKLIWSAQHYVQQLSPRSIANVSIVLFETIAAEYQHHLHRLGNDHYRPSKPLDGDKELQRFPRGGEMEPLFRWPSVSLLQTPTSTPRASENAKASINKCENG
jgi:phosphoenolpyruvate carboxylase